MKHIIIAVVISTSFLALGTGANASELKLPFFKLFQGNKAAHHGKGAIPDCPDCQKPEKVVKLKTIELSRRAFTKWEEHCCGIKMKGNYIKVTYETFYSDGTSQVWCHEYRS